METPTLFLLPSSLGEENPLEVLPSSYLSVVEPLRFFFVEEVRTARRFLRKIGFTAPFEEVTFISVNEHHASLSMEDILLESGWNKEKEPSFPLAMGLLSEAGIPCVADPGATVVAWAHAHRFKVKPLVGPSSLFLSLMASGLNGQNFAFIGYLPAEPEARNKRIKEIERTSSWSKQTQIFIETPYRNLKLWESLVQQCRPQTRLCVAKNLLMPGEQILTLSISEWKHRGAPSFCKENAVFLLLSE